MIPHVEVPEHTHVTLLARVKSVTDELILIDDVASIELNVFDLSGPTPLTFIHGESLTVAEVIFDTIQTDARWDVDSTGYNFRFEVTDPEVMVAGGKRYRYEVLLRMDTGVIGGPIRKAWEVTALPMTIGT